MRRVHAGGIQGLEGDPNRQLTARRATGQHARLHRHREQSMLKTLAVLAVSLAALPAFAQTPEVTLTRLDCGTGFNDQRRFSDTFAYTDPKVPFTFSCYVIKHGDDYMVWDTGFVPGSNANAPKVSLTEQLTQLKIKPEQIKYVGISHYHGDHIGQVGSFPKATLLIGKGDWDVLTSPKPPENANPAPFANWIKGESKVEPVPLDKDVFGDGSVIMLYTPGHTPGHHSLLVKLPQMGNVLLSGDLMHFRENYDTNGVPAFNTDRSQTLASLDRVKKIVAGSKAAVVIQHDARDVDKLPAFPASAK
jgi:glyoxylase-like metal-dependent hydrolase (beta-lactamase superfamily II)